MVILLKQLGLKSAGGNMSCVLQSQVSRLFLYQRSFVKPDDVIGLKNIYQNYFVAYAYEMVDRKIYKTEMKFWTVLAGGTAERKKNSQLP